MSFIYSYFIYLHYQKPLKTHLLVFTVIPWSKLLINTFCSLLGSTLLFIESTMVHPLYLWDITNLNKSSTDISDNAPKLMMQCTREALARHNEQAQDYAHAPQQLDKHEIASLIWVSS
jgi:hypothetical protein